MQININNKPLDTQATTLGMLAAELSLPAKGVAVAIAGKMVQRSLWAETALSEDMHITIIKAACGG